VRDPTERLRDMLDAIAAIDRYRDRDRASFDRDELLQVWFLRHLQILGEAASGLRRMCASSLPTSRGRVSSACVATIPAAPPIGPEDETAGLPEHETGEWSRHSDLNRGPAVYETASGVPPLTLRSCLGGSSSGG